MSDFETFSMVYWSCAAVYLICVAVGHRYGLDIGVFGCFGRPSRPLAVPPPDITPR